MCSHAARWRRRGDLLAAPDIHNPSTGPPHEREAARHRAPALPPAPLEASLPHAQHLLRGRRGRAQHPRAGAAGACIQRRADHRHAFREHGAAAALLRQRRHRAGALRGRDRRALGPRLHQHRPGVLGNARALGLPHEARVDGASRRHEQDLGFHRAPGPARDRDRHAAHGPHFRTAQDLPAPLREGAAGG